MQQQPQPVKASDHLFKALFVNMFCCTISVKFDAVACWWWSWLGD
jgi:hypothetical protein